MKKILISFVLLVTGIQAQAVPITISTDAEFVAAHQSLPDAEDPFITAINASSLKSDSNIFNVLFDVFKLAIDTQNSDMEYFLSQLQYMNDVGEAMRDYLQGLANSSSELQDRLRSSYLQELGIDAGFETTSDELFLALYDSDSDSPITVVGDISSDDTGTVNAFMRSYGIPIIYTVPEPSTLSLMGLVLACLVYILKRKAT